MALKLFSRKKKRHREANCNGRAHSTYLFSPTGDGDYMPAPVERLDDHPLKRLSQQGRYNVILNDENSHRHAPGADVIIEATKRRLEQRMALVPAGTASFHITLTSEPGAPEEEEEVQPFLLDVRCVTNARFQMFVDAGGYDELEYWPEEIWPHLIELKDVTGQPAPRYWRNGRHDVRLANHPVVGVSWYEAQAFALWIGQRLPTEAEWQMAASWHVNSSADLMRRFPWGDAMDNTRCNIWSSRRGGTVPVNEYGNGAAPNQVLQLVGNVWEWTDTEYTVTDPEGRPIVGEMPMHVTRGGAFDTYFETQATNYFRTGQIALARSNNTGFRCAMNLDEASWLCGD